MASKARRKYPEEFKRDAVELVRSSGKSQAQIARELGTSAHNLNRWCKEYRGKESAVEEHEITPEAFRAMERELRCVKEERDILKKALNIFSRSG